MAYLKWFVSLETTEKGKPFEKEGRKAEDLRHSTRSYDGRAAWDTKTYFRGEFYHENYECNRWIGHGVAGAYHRS